MGFLLGQFVLNVEELLTLLLVGSCFCVMVGVDTEVRCAPTNETLRGGHKPTDGEHDSGYRVGSALVGMVASGGNPLGAALGSGLGSLLSGGSMQDAFRSGIGSFMTGSTMGKAGLAMGMMGGGSPQSQGANFLNMIASQQGREAAAITLKRVGSL